MLTRLRVVAGWDNPVYPVERWGDLGDTVRRHPVEVAILDPCVEADAPHQDAIRALRIAAPTVAVVIYTSATAEAMRTVADLMQRGWIRQCVLDGFDDDPKRFRALLEELCLPGREEHVLADLLPIRAVFEARPKPAMAVTKLFHGHQYAQYPGFSIAEVAGRLRDLDWRVFAEHVRTITGVAPSAWLGRARPDECVAQIVARLLRCDDPSPFPSVACARVNA